MPVTIKESVGRNGKNKPDDVKAVQQGLATLYPGAGIKASGACDDATVKAIETLQIGCLPKPDGRIDPGGKSLKHLNDALGKVVSLAEWSGDSSKWAQDKKLQSLNPDFRVKVQRVMEELTRKGFQPTIFYGWRSTEVQMQLFKAGNSTVKFSFHNVTGPNGQPNSMAADIIDKRWAWGPEAQKNGFWDALGAATRAQGIYWGGDWRGFKDVAHIQHHPNEKLEELRRQQLGAA